MSHVSMVVHQKRNRTAVASVSVVRRPAFRCAASCLVTRQRAIFVTFTLAASLLTSSLSAQDARLNVDLAGSSPRVRPNAPVQLVLKVYWNGTSIVEGRFEARYFAGGYDMRSETLSQEMVLTPGEQTIRMTLPSSGSTMGAGQDEVALKFITSKEVFDLKRYPVSAATAIRKSTICVIGPTDRQPTTEAELTITDTVRIGNVLADSLPRNAIPTAYSRWDNIDVPEQSLQFCCFDLVLLRPEGLVDLRQKQLTALQSWVRAGGSLAVLLPSQLEANQVTFLNELLSEAVESPFVLDTQGKLVKDTSSSKDGIWQSHAELGRVVVFDLQTVGKNLEGTWPDIRRAAGFLWKLRRRAERNLNRSRLTQQQLNQIQSQNRRGNASRDLSWQPLQSSGHFVGTLMPDDVRVVPLGLIGIILFGYLILIGPVDYFVLGHFKRRRWTWITFPLTTLLVAWFCVWMSDWFLSSESMGKTLLVRDLGADGTVLRESEFELKFLSRRKEIESEVENAIFTQLNTDRLMAMRGNLPGQHLASQRSQFEGRMPGNYRVRQVIPQWTPVVNRWFRIAPEQQKVEGFDFSDKQILDTSYRARLREQILARWPEATALLLHSGAMRNRTRDYGAERITGTGNLFSELSEYGFDEFSRMNRNWRRGNRIVPRFEVEICHRPQSSFFTQVSQISPHGGDNFEDMAIYDVEDPDQAVLLIFLVEDNQLTLYRRLYNGLEDHN